MNSSLRLICQKDENTYGWRECSSGIPKLREYRTLEGFSWKEQCFICGKECKEDKRHPDRRPIYQVTFLHYRETILNISNFRKEDPWGLEVKRRIINCIDLVPEKIRYHDDCHAKFTSGKPEKISSQQRGRPQNSTQQFNFGTLCE